MKKISNRAFTLIELIAVITIIGIIVTVATIGVNVYINNAKKNTYNSYVKNMETSAANRMIQCSTDEKKCSIPQSGYKEKITLNKLIDEGYSEKLKDPEGDGFCDGYVDVKNDGGPTPDLKYNACLKCSKYETNGCNFDDDNDDDNYDKILSCDNLNPIGESTTWTNQARTIKFGCDAQGKNCKYSKTFNANPSKPVIKTGTINIANGQTCSFNVYIDTTKPTCKIVTSNAEVGDNNWYLEDVTVKLTYSSNSNRDIKDFDFGLTTSTKKEYNRKESLTLKTGITTVFGYVKDDLGNEGYCSEEIKVDSNKPTQDLMLGYQVYPEVKNNNNIESDTLVLDDLDKYKSVKGALVFLKENATGNIDLNYASMTATTAGSGGYGSIMNTTEGSMRVFANNTKLVEFIFNKASTYTSMNITGINPTKIDKVILLVGNTNGLYTNKDMIVYTFAKDNGTGVASTNGYSFDGGTTWQNEKYKKYTQNPDPATVIVKVKDTLGSISESSTIKVNKIDKLSPTCSITGNPTTWTNQNVNLKINGVDPGISGLNTIKIGTSNPISFNGSYNHEISVNGSYYFEVEDKAGNTNYCSTTVNKIDKIAPTVTISIPNASIPSKSKTATVTITDNQSKLKGQTVYYSWGSSQSPSSFSQKTINDNVSTFSFEVPLNYGTGTYYLWVISGIKDNANNSSVSKRSPAVVMDNNPPSCPVVTKTSGANPKTWTNKEIKLSIKPTADTASWQWATNTNGGDFTTFTVDGNADRTGDLIDFAAFSGEGKRQGRIIVKDAAGNSRTCYTDEYWIDKTPPSCPVITKTSGANPKTWTNKEIRLSIKPTADTASWQWATNTNGDDYTTHAVNGSIDRTGDLINFSAFSGQGKRSGRVVVKDVAGNTKTCYTDEYWIDKTAPTVKITAYKQGESIVAKSTSTNPTNYDIGSKDYKLRIELNKQDTGLVYNSGIDRVTTTIGTLNDNGHIYINNEGSSSGVISIYDKAGNVRKLTVKANISLSKTASATNIGGNYCTLHNGVGNSTTIAYNEDMSGYNCDTRSYQTGYRYATLRINSVTTSNGKVKVNLTISYEGNVGTWLGYQSGNADYERRICIADSRKYSTASCVTSSVILKESGVSWPISGNSVTKTVTLNMPSKAGNYSLKIFSPNCQYCNPASNSNAAKNILSFITNWTVSVK